MSNYQQLSIEGSLDGFNYWSQIDVDGVAIKTKVLEFLAAGLANP